MTAPIRITRIHLVITGFLAALTGVDEGGRPQATVFAFLVRVEPFNAS